jgi:hypothetical protein
MTLVALLLATLPMAIAQHEDPAGLKQMTSSWFGVSLGLPNSLHLGFSDLFARDLDLRVDAFTLVWNIFDQESFPENHTGACASLIFSPTIGESWIGQPISLYFGAGPAVSMSTGTYLGINGLVGLEPGRGDERWFVEAGASYTFRVAGTGEATMLAPRFATGVNFYF